MLTGEAVYEPILDILEGKEMPVGLNDTFLSLISKVNNLQRVT